MPKNRTLQKAPRTRPVKKPRERKRRDKVQRARLIALGVPEDEAANLNTRQVREMLKRPARVKKRYA